MLQILKHFFEIDTEKKYQKFVSSYAQTQLGALLLKIYDETVSDPSILDCLSEEDKYMVRLSEEERLLERVEGRQEERIEIAKKLLSQNMDIVFISSITGLSEKEIEFLN